MTPLETEIPVALLQDDALLKKSSSEDPVSPSHSESLTSKGQGRFQASGVPKHARLLAIPLLLTVLAMVIGKSEIAEGALKSFHRDVHNISKHHQGFIGTYSNNITLLEPLLVPSMERPFIFFHQRKCGGTTLRDQIHIAAKKASAPFFIPCYPNASNPKKPPEFVHCQTYYTPQVSDIRYLPNKQIPIVYGGHFFYPSFQKTLYLFHNTPHNVPTIEPPRMANFTCLTIFREPIARIQSCWNYRMIQKNYGNDDIINFASIPAIYMKQNLTTAMNKYGEGCLNEPMRIFSDYGDDEFIVNRLHEPHLADMANHATKQTLSRIADHCVVGVVERCNDTRAAIVKYIPFLEPYINECSGGGERLNSGVVSKGELDEEQLEVLRELSWYEDEVYQEANRILDAQVESL
ncbi:expressed unknown protein [Seminavis robusta]|uniref:Sulfotransferase n=1 Tax=Seminavis robusta TaxID=568900 RepID=A0A9N8HCV3_9STRA|nr:expressed unknown protein [Seminavis robusta]|eukprot:Sro429_g141200.1 n/a (406) ;mRNA; f:60314-61531